MKTLLLLAVLVIAAVIVLNVLKKRAGTDKGAEREPPKRKHPLTAHEQAMYNRLATAAPEHVVLAQVSFGALLYASSKAVRNTFDRKIADFVICTKAFQVVAVVELDDSTHRNKADRDAKRDDMLAAAGYRVLRYPQIPDIDRVQRDLATPREAQS